MIYNKKDLGQEIFSFSIFRLLFIAAGLFTFCFLTAITNVHAASYGTYSCFGSGSTGGCRVGDNNCTNGGTIPSSPECTGLLPPDCNSSSFPCISPTATPTPLPTATFNDIAIPEPVIPCIEKDLRGLPGSVLKNPEFHSMRPYQASPCWKAPVVAFCNNDFIIGEAVSMRWNSNRCTSSPTYTCTPEDPIIIGGEEGRDYEIRFNDVKLPIVGNTQDVINSQQPGNTLDASQLMNEYADWYLQGVTDRAEFGNDVPDEFLSFSGPTKKLVPWDILNLRRHVVLHNGTVREWMELDPSEYPYPSEDVINLGNIQVRPGDKDRNPQIRLTKSHNQIVVCGGSNPKPCYNGSGNWVVGQGKASSPTRLMKWWESRGSVPGDTYLKGYRWETTSIFGWRKATPPYPWLFGDQLSYQKAFNEWRGKICTVILNQLFCFDLPFGIGGPGQLALNYRFIPLGDSADKDNKHLFGGMDASANGETVAEIKSYALVSEPILHYSHTDAVVQTAEVLNKTHTPIACDEETGDCKPVEGRGTNYEPRSCEFLDVRLKNGDNLTFDNPVTIFQINDVITEVSQIECDEQQQIDEFVNICGGRVHRNDCEFARCNEALCGNCGELPEACRSWPSCSDDVEIVIKSTPRIPNVEKIWEKTVVDKTSPFRRLFPKMVPGAPIQCIDYIPGVSKAFYNTNDQTNLTAVNTAGPKTFPGAGAGSTTAAELYFPYLGTVLEYFLHGIQTAVLPLGYGQPLIGNENCLNSMCTNDFLVNFTGDGACGLRSTNVRGGMSIPPTYQQILEEAAGTYDVPASLIVGVLFGEGVYNGGNYKGNSAFPWSEENVIKWASCEPLPNCTSPETSIINFGNSEKWSKAEGQIREDIKKLYPEGLPEGRPDPCNLIDATYAIAYDLYWMHFGNPEWTTLETSTGKRPSCLGITLNNGSTEATSCGTWDDDDYVTAIREWEFGTCYGNCPDNGNPNRDGVLTCATEPGSCATGGGYSAQCQNDSVYGPWDSCPADDSTHTGCVFDVSQGR